jgi:hypothetical protein
LNWSGLLGIKYSGTSPIVDFSLYDPGPDTFNLLFYSEFLVLGPNPYFGDSFLLFK